VIDHPAYGLISSILVLDFYVLEDCQRLGIGKILFDRFLHHVGDMSAHDVAYDRPSPKLYAFLRKHFNLADDKLDFQPNKYAVSVHFLEKLSSTKKK